MFYIKNVFCFILFCFTIFLNIFEILLLQRAGITGYLNTVAVDVMN